MIKFGHIEYLFLLGLIPVLVLFIFLFSRWRKKTLLKFTTKNLEDELYVRKSDIREKWKYTLQILAVLFLILGLSNPQIGTNLKEVKRDGIEMVIALDLSNSMLCKDDIGLSRLRRSKQAISELIDNLEGDRIGLVVFAGEAYTQLPITSDYSVARMFLNTVNTETIETQGTNLSAAIRQSVKSFDLDNEFNKSIIIITDGEDHEKGALQEAELAAEKGISIQILSVGDTNGGPIPKINSEGYKKYNGHTIVTTPNFPFLERLSVYGNGKHIRLIANDSEFALQQLFKEISKISKKEISTMKFTDYTDRFQLFLFVSLFLFLLELSVLKIKNNPIKKWMKR
ncbi:VWA domain-containing protein [Flavobacteriales bacterium]|nr:VWA domain-containing protein [Flavobacteriales bacterium]